MESEAFNKDFGYTVSNETGVVSRHMGITPEIKEALQEIGTLAQKGKKSALKKITEAIDKYPHIPQFKNYLSVWYSLQGEHKMAFDVNRLIMEEHPDYLFARMNLARECLYKNEYDNIPAILGEAMDLKALYPNRTEFHLSEMVNFYQIAAQYFIAKEDVENAEKRVAVLELLQEEFGEDLNLDEEIGRYRILLMGLRVKMNLASSPFRKVNPRVVEVKASKVVALSTDKPLFTHDLIEQLYTNSLRIDLEIVKQILLLPRESLIADLHKVVYDSMARMDYFSNQLEWTIDTHEFVIHALLLLTELKSEDSLEVLLDVLRQDMDYLDFWFGDTLTKETDRCVFVLGQHQLEKLKNFVLEPNHAVAARTLVSDVVVQIALLQPERKNEVLVWFNDLLTQVILNKDNQDIIDGDWTGGLVANLLDLHANELLPLIKKMYDLELVNEEICGDYNNVAREIIAGARVNHSKTRFYDDIYTVYNRIIQSWFYYNKSTEADDIRDRFNILPTTKPLVNENKTIGRNDPCPCGSGKKYKKCCLK